MNSKDAAHLALKCYCQLRSLNFGAQYWALNRASQALGFKTTIRYQDHELLKLIQSGLDELIDSDLKRIQGKYYPIEVLRPDLSLSALLKLPKVVLDGFRVGRRRTRGKAKEFTQRAREYFDGLPDYYLRNFHFQTDGYLGDVSADVYDYEVDLLFSGATDAMRRLIIAPLKDHFGKDSNGQGLKFLEIGPGTGRSTQFIKMAFPKAQIYGVDLSEPYLRQARRTLGKFSNINFFQGDGSHLPFKDGEFDAVYSIFLYHELPLDVRRKLIEENLRVLKSGGIFGYVDSIQKGDRPEFDFFLTEFPKNFHEPFYINYISHSMESLVATYPVRSLQRGIGLLSKFEIASKN